MLKLNSSLLTTCVFLAAAATVPAHAQVAPAPSAASGVPAQPPTVTAQAMAGPTPVPAAAPQSSAAQLNLLYTGELWNEAAGGLSRGTTYMYNVDAALHLDAEKAFGWSGARFVLEGFYESQNSFGNQYAGAVDQQSPIDSAGFAMFRLYQAYYDQTLGNTDILFGIYDLETEFSVTKPMSLFLSKDLTWNTALDQSGTMPQNGTIGPGNYPYTPLALRIRQTISHDWSVQAVIADGASDNPNHQASNGIYFSSNDGALGMAEVDYTPSAHTKLMGGVWELTSKLPTNDVINPDGSPRDVWGENGGYIGGATRLYSLTSRRGLDGFFTLGVSSQKSTNVAHSLNGGLVYTGLLDVRPTDKIGVSFNVNANPPSYRQAALALGLSDYHYETSFELTYRARINSWVTVQPDFQYIVHPNYDPTIKDDLIFGFHFEIGHFFDL